MRRGQWNANVWAVALGVVIFFGGNLQAIAQNGASPERQFYSLEELKTKLHQWNTHYHGVNPQKMIQTAGEYVQWFPDDVLSEEKQKLGIDPNKIQPYRYMIDHDDFRKLSQGETTLYKSWFYLLGQWADLAPEGQYSIRRNAYTFLQCTEVILIWNEHVRLKQNASSQTFHPIVGLADYEKLFTDPKWIKELSILKNRDGESIFPARLLRNLDTHPGFKFLMNREAGDGNNLSSKEVWELITGYRDDFIQSSRPAQVAEQDPAMTHFENTLITNEMHKLFEKFAQDVNKPTIDRIGMFRQYYVEGKSFLEIAAMYNLSDSAISKHVNRVKWLLREPRYKELRDFVLSSVENFGILTDAYNQRQKQIPQYGVEELRKMALWANNIEVKEFREGFVNADIKQFAQNMAKTDAWKEAKIKILESFQNAGIHETQLKNFGLTVSLDVAIDAFLRWSLYQALQQNHRYRTTDFWRNFNRYVTQMEYQIKKTRWIHLSLIFGNLGLLERKLNESHLRHWPKSFMDRWINQSRPLLLADLEDKRRNTGYRFSRTRRMLAEKLDAFKKDVSEQKIWLRTILLEFLAFTIPTQEVLADKTQVIETKLRQHAVDRFTGEGQKSDHHAKEKNDKRKNRGGSIGFGGLQDGLARGGYLEGLLNQFLNFVNPNKTESEEKQAARSEQPSLSEEQMSSLKKSYWESIHRKISSIHTGEQAADVLRYIHAGPAGEGQKEAVQLLLTKIDSLTLSRNSNKSWLFIQPILQVYKEQISSTHLSENFSASFGHFYSALVLSRLMRASVDPRVDVPKFSEFIKMVPVEMVRLGSFSAGAAVGNTVARFAMDLLPLIRVHTLERLMARKILQADAHRINKMIVLASSRMQVGHGIGRRIVLSQVGFMSGVLVNKLLYENKPLDSQFWKEYRLEVSSFMFAMAGVKSVTRTSRYIITGAKVLSKASGLLGLLELSLELTLAPIIAEEMHKIDEQYRLGNGVIGALESFKTTLSGAGSNTILCSMSQHPESCAARQLGMALNMYFSRVYLRELSTVYLETETSLRHIFADAKGMRLVGHEVAFGQRLNQEWLSNASARKKIIDRIVHTKKNGSRQINDFTKKFEKDLDHMGSLLRFANTERKTMEDIELKHCIQGKSSLQCLLAVIEMESQSEKRYQAQWSQHHWDMPTADYRYSSGHNLGTNGSARNQHSLDAVLNYERNPKNALMAVGHELNTLMDKTPHYHYYVKVVLEHLALALYENAERIDIDGGREINEIVAYAANGGFLDPHLLMPYYAQGIRDYFTQINGGVVHASAQKISYVDTVKELNKRIIRVVMPQSGQTKSNVRLEVEKAITLSVCRSMQRHLISNKGYVLKEDALGFCDEAAKNLIEHWHQGDKPAATISTWNQGSGTAGNSNTNNATDGIDESFFGAGNARIVELGDEEDDYTINGEWPAIIVQYFVQDYLGSQATGESLLFPRESVLISKQYTDQLWVYFERQYQMAHPQ